MAGAALPVLAVLDGGNGGLGPGVDFPICLWSGFSLIVLSAHEIAHSGLTVTGERNPALSRAIS
jgi:hypothetical protein